MKIRNCVLLLTCIAFTTIIIFLYGDSQPSINNLVTKTQGKINSWANSKVIEKIKNDLDPAAKYLKNLGFFKNSVFYPEQILPNVPLPIFVTAVSSADIELVPRYVGAFQFYIPEYHLQIYTLDITYSELSRVHSICNSSSCSVHPFDFESYPSHVEDLKFSAYRPIIIQEVLNQSGAAFWLDIQYVITSNNVKDLLNQAQKEGVISWSIDHPTSSLTHPRMFDYFHTNQENFYFHRMIQPRHIIFYNTANIHKQLMLPWVTCALVSDCIAPIGSQSTGCRFDKKPLFRYSGCHRYDTSALNVALGVMFDYSANRYTAKEDEKFFHHIEYEIKQTTLPKDYFVKNSTSLFSDGSN